MNAEQLINKYRNIYGKGSQQKINQDQYLHLKKWLENEIGKKMPRPFYITIGDGGGQKFRLWWLVFDILGNKNTPCYFYTSMDGIATTYLIKHGHKTLQNWIDDKSEHLKYNINQA